MKDYTDDGGTEIDTDLNDNQSKIHINKEIPNEHNRVDIMIDLHGLTAEEAVFRLDKNLPTWTTPDGDVKKKGYNKSTEAAYKYLAIPSNQKGMRSPTRSRSAAG